MTVTEFPRQPEPEWLVGPFEEYRVVIEGRMIPGLTAFKDGEQIALVVDRRFSISLPKELARQTAWLIANALAVGAGYAWLGAETKDRPFAPKCSEITDGL